MSHCLTLRRYAAYWLIGLALAAAVFVACLAVGPGYSPREPFRWGFPGHEALQLRALRVLTAALVGMALAGSGVALQALLRNALADPYVLGISSGASVGVMLWLLGIGPAVATLTLPALVGALATCAVVFVLARSRSGAMDPLTLLLVGVIIGAFNGAIVMVLNAFAPGGVKVNLLYYLMGAVSDGLEPYQVVVAGAAVVAGWVPLALAGAALNISTFSDAEVASLGVRLGLLRNMAFVCASLMTAASIALAGPIGFVGLICPHVCRALFGPDHRQLTVTAPLCGAVFLMLADTLVRSSLFLTNGELPVGVVTACCGGPFFLFLLKRRGVMYAA